MKNVLFALTFLALLSCKAQLPIISMVDYANSDNLEITPGAYLKDVENKFTPFLGTWQWTNGNSTFIIAFEKIEFIYDDEIYEDHVVGKYKYIENGVEVLNTLSYNPIHPSNFWYSTKGIIRGSSGTTDNYLDFSYVDELKNKQCHASVKLHSNGSTNSTEIKWSLWTRQTITHNGENSFRIVGSSLPREVVLTKQRD